MVLKNDFADQDEIVMAAATRKGVSQPRVVS